MQAWKSACIDLEFVDEWAHETDLQAVFGEVVQPNLSAHIARVVRRIREKPLAQVQLMCGPTGVIGIVRAIYEALIVDPGAEGQLMVVVSEIARIFNALHSPPEDTSGTIIDYLTETDAAKTQHATAILNEMAEV